MVPGRPGDLQHGVALPVQAARPQGCAGGDRGRGRRFRPRPGRSTAARCRTAARPGRQWACGAPVICGFPDGTRRRESTAATAATTVNTVKASVNPSIEGVLVRPAAATVEATATQMAAPSWLKVLTMPDTSPASCRLMRPRAEVVAQTNSGPPPSANTVTPGRASA